MNWCLICGIRACLPKNISCARCAGIILADADARIKDIERGTH